MEVAYKKDLDKSYLLIKQEYELEDDYRMKMAYRNTIPGFCQVSVKNFNDGSTLYYDITQKISFTSLYGKHKMKKNDITRYIIGIQRALESSKEYLLDMDKILLDFDYVYADQENGSVSFCYYPEKQEDFYQSLQKSMLDMIKMTDHTDKETVILSYGIQQLSSSDNVTIGDIMKFLKSDSFTNDKAKYSMPFDYEGIETDSGSDRIVDAELIGNQNGLEISNTDENNICDESRCSGSNFKKDFGIGLKEKRSGIIQKIKSMLVSKKRNIIEDDYDLLGEEIYSAQSNTDCNYQSEFDKKSYEFHTMHEREITKERLNYSMEKEEEEYATVLLTGLYKREGIVLQGIEENTSTIIPDSYPCIIGKSKRSSDCLLMEKTVSRVHARLDDYGGEYTIEDLNSTNGTFLNGEKLKPHSPCVIKIGDIIALSNLEFRIVDDVTDANSLGVHNVL